MLIASLLVAALLFKSASWALGRANYHNRRWLERTGPSYPTPRHWR